VCVCMYVCTYTFLTNFHLTSSVSFAWLWLQQYLDSDFLCACSEDLNYMGVTSGNQWIRRSWDFCFLFIKKRFVFKVWNSNRDFRKSFSHRERRPHVAWLCVSVNSAAYNSCCFGIMISFFNWRYCKSPILLKW